MASKNKTSFGGGQGNGVGGLQPCWNWESQSDDSEPILWSVDSRDGLIQGPLDFDFLRGKKMIVQLGPQQIALLIRGGLLQAVFLEGSHPLAVGNQEGQVPPECQLLFLAAEQPFSLQWKRGDGLWVAGEETGPERIPLIGHCHCKVEDPARFFAAFLRFSEQAGEEFTLRVIDALVRSNLERIVADWSTEGPLGTPELRKKLTRIRAEDLVGSLAESGLVCTALRIEVGQPAAETVADPETLMAGQIPAGRDNRD